MGRGSAKLKHSSKCDLSLRFLRPRRGEEVDERRGGRDYPGTGGQITDQEVSPHCRWTSSPSVVDGMSLAAGILNLTPNNRALLGCGWASAVVRLGDIF